MTTDDCTTEIRQAPSSCIEDWVPSPTHYLPSAILRPSSRPGFADGTLGRWLSQIIPVVTWALHTAVTGERSCGRSGLFCAHHADLVCVAVQGVITERPWLVVLPLGATVMDEDHPVCCVWVKHPYSARIEIHNHAVGWNR